jgi:hypothetical protein
MAQTHLILRANEPEKLSIEQVDGNWTEIEKRTKIASANAAYDTAEKRVAKIKALEIEATNSTPNEEQITGTSYINLAATGTIPLNFDTKVGAYLTLTGATTLDITPPTLLAGESTVRSINITGDFALVLDPTQTDVSGEYVGTQDCIMTILYTRLDATTLKVFTSIIADN